MTQIKKMNYNYQSGLSLIEMMIIISIITIFTLIFATAMPAVRANQYLTTDRSELEFLLRHAERLAINEQRSDECLNQAGEDSDLRKRCSDIGVALQESKAVLFADTTGNRAYTAGDDFVLEERELRTTVSSAAPGAWQSFLFEATPPTVTMYYNGTVLPPNSSATVTLQTGSSERSFFVFPYRHLDDPE